MPLLKKTRGVGLVACTKCFLVAIVVLLESGGADSQRYGVVMGQLSKTQLGQY